MRAAAKATNQITLQFNKYDQAGVFEPDATDTGIKIDMDTDHKVSWYKAGGRICALVTATASPPSYDSATGLYDSLSIDTVSFIVDYYDSSKVKFDTQEF